MVCRWIVPWLRLPAEPVPPAGDPASVRVFRAGRGFYWVTLARWAIGQAATLAGIVVSIGFLLRIEMEVDRMVAESEAPMVAPAEATGEPAVVAPERHPGRKEEWARGVAAWLAPKRAWLLPVIKVVEALGLVSYAAQLVATFVVLRLEFEMRWYMVTDRSLRIRWGVWRVQEMTMSFANLQKVELSRGPLQQLLGIGDIRVQSAGGGGGKEDEEAHDSLHTGVFHGVTNAIEIRDLIQARLRQFREAGLGDPDDHLAPAPPEATSGDPTPGAADLPGAVAELLAEARALRASLGA